VDRAEALWREMKELYRAGARNLKPSAVTYNSIIQAWCRSGNSSAAGEQADKYLQEMKDSNMKPNKYVYSTAIKAWKMSKDAMAKKRISVLEGELKLLN